MATQAEVDEQRVLLALGLRDQSRENFRKNHDELFLDLMMDVVGKIESYALVPLGDVNTPAGILSYQNIFTAPILVSLLIDATAVPGALTADFGSEVTAISSDDLIDGVDIATGPLVFTSFDDQGTNGRTYRRVEVGEFVTGTTATGDATGLVGSAYINFRFTT